MTFALLATFLVVLGMFTLVFLFASIKRNNSIVDIFWGMGFIAATIYTLLTFSNFHWYQLIASALIVIWGLRLSLRILLRNWGRPEDWRYAEYRKKWNPNTFYLQSYISIFVVQALLCTVIASPIIVINFTSNLQWPFLFVCGVLVWMIGFLLESISDWQLDRFIASKPQKGAVLSSGLWKFSRHPNYFGESTQWWGMGLLALACTPLGWWALVGPLTITFLLLKVTGIPLLEQKMQQNPNYQAYMRRTNKFIPGPTK